MRRGAIFALALLAACSTRQPLTVRIATFNIQELGAAKLGDPDSAGAGHPQALAAAAIIQRVRPDVLLLNELDHHAAATAGADLGAYARRFEALYLRRGADSLAFPYIYVAPSNTGILSGRDLNQDGVAAGASDLGTRAHGDDSYGFGVYPGQYAMAILSRFPFDSAGSRTFQRFLWRDLPAHLMPEGFYPDSIVAVLRLSSKSHWDVPLIVGGGTLHLLASHPTPPVFDGPEDRNGRRNYDEVGFWARYLDGSEALVDDRGRRGGLAAGSRFAILGDLNASPEGEESRYHGRRSIEQLLRHPLVQDAGPHAPTASFAGGVRVDYVLPSRNLRVVASGLFAPDPARDSLGAAWARTASDHRLVWLDLSLGPR